jgi:low affinity Fe/Cu permease
VYPTSPFTRFATWTARMAGHPGSFMLAVLIILAWTLSGPLFHCSATWHLDINTGTTIITLLMVFLNELLRSKLRSIEDSSITLAQQAAGNVPTEIQNTQHRDSAAIQLKQDELIRVTQGAHNALLDLEELPEADLDQLRAHDEKLAQQAREDLWQGLRDTGTPEVHTP